MVLCLILAQVAIWTAVPALFHTSLPLDVVREGLAWGHEWQWGYEKHPPLTSWLIELSFDALGDVGPFLLSQLAIAATYTFVYLLGCEVMEPRRAAAGTLLLAGSFYFSFPTPEFNQNVAQMPLWACAVFAFYRSIHSGRLRWWLLLGVAIGLGGLVKYSVAVLALAMGLYLLAMPSYWAALATAGPYLAVAVSLSLMSPHFYWIVHNDFVTLRYAVNRAGHAATLLDRFSQPLHFLAAQVADQLGILALLGLAGFLGRGALERGPTRRDEGLRFLLFFGLAPAGIVALGSLATGFGLRDMWGAPMWNCSGLLAVMLLRGRTGRVSLRRLVLGVAMLLSIVPAAFGVAATIGSPGPRGPRTAWPDRAIAAAFADGYRAATGCTLRIVAGSGWLAGLVAMRSDPRPSVLLDGDLAASPWVTPQRIDRQGLLVVWEIGREQAIADRLAQLPRFREVGTKEFAWPYRPSRPRLAIGWGVVPRAQPGACAATPGDR
jgi:4-amino-4-deoxy-L-arabinose transferase-like glycosyltransferase